MGVSELGCDRNTGAVRDQTITFPESIQAPQLRRLFCDLESTSGYSANDQKRFPAGNNVIRQRRIRRFVREILGASKEPQEGAPLLGHVITNRAAEHRVLHFKRIEDGSGRDRPLQVQLNLALNVAKCPQVMRQYNTNHGSVCTSTDSTAGRS